MSHGGGWHFASFDALLACEIPLSRREPDVNEEAIWDTSTEHRAQSGESGATSSTAGAEGTGSFRSKAGCDIDAHRPPAGRGTDARTDAQSQATGPGAR